MDDAAPVWLLDVDGVINATRPGWGSRPRHGDAHFNGQTFQMRWAPELVDRLCAYHLSGAAEFRWATTWVDEIGQLERLMGLPRFPVAFSGLDQSPQVKVPGLKTQAALKVVEQEHRSLLWTDDDAIPRQGDLRERLENAALPILLLAPDPYYGLRPEHLDRIDAFLDH